MVREEEPPPPPPPPPKKKKKKKEEKKERRNLTQFLASLCCSLTNLKAFLLPKEAAGRIKEPSKTHFVLVAKRRVNTETQRTNRFSFGCFPPFALTGPWKSIQRYAAVFAAHCRLAASTAQSERQSLLTLTAPDTH